MNKDFFKTAGGRALIWAVAIIAIALFFWLTAPKSASKMEAGTNVNNQLTEAKNTNAAASTNVNAPTKAQSGAPTKKPTAKPVGFIEKRTPHFVAATIANNATLNAAPSILTLNFDTFLAKNNQSLVTVTKNGITSVVMNSSAIDGKTLTVKLNPEVANGDYSVYYVACFADTGCSDGRFGYHLKLP